jgi:polar amino acid transport system substrate-binding protein
MRKLFAIVSIILGNFYAGAHESELRWAADAESGMPSVFYNADGQLDGFEKEIVEEVCKQLGKKSVFCQNDWDWLIPGLTRELYDAIVDGLTREATANSKIVLFSMPYYVCQLSLVVRENEEKIKSIEQCVSKKVGVLCNSKGRVLLRGRRDIIALEYPSEYSAFSDLKSGRIDAALIDYPAAIYSISAIDGIRIVDNIDRIKYSIAVNENNRKLLRDINRALLELFKSGKVQTIVSEWGLNNELFEEYTAKVTSADGVNARENLKIGQTLASVGKFQKYAKLLSIFAKAALITLEVSVGGMVLAVLLGLLFVLIRLYAPRWIGLIVAAIIEAIRGTPLLIQLFFIFYGLPTIGITLRPLVAGMVALGINYAAYESENFRAGLGAVPSGQMEAARALGMSQWQSLRHVVIPQAFSFVLPTLTNDFIAIIKESSLVSLITIVELTKAYTMAASSSFDFLGTGLIVAAFYFALGFPFVRLAKLAENHLALEKRAYRAKRATKKPNFNPQ